MPPEESVTVPVKSPWTDCATAVNASESASAVKVRQRCRDDKDIKPLSYRLMYTFHARSQGKRFRSRNCHCDGTYASVRPQRRHGRGGPSACLMARCLH